MPGKCGKLLRSLPRQTMKYKRNKATMVSDFEMACATIGNKVRSFDEIPGPRGLPFLGTLISYLPGGRFYKMEHNDVSDIQRSEYGNIFKETIPGGDTIVHTFEAADVETIFRNDGKFPVREAFFTLQHYNKKFQDNSQGLLTSQMERWQHLRVNVQKNMLRPKAVAAYISEHSIVANDFLDRISRDQDEDGRIEDLKPELTKYAAECIGVVCFNKRFGSFQNDDESSEAKLFTNAVRDVMHVSHMEFRQLPLFRLFNTPTFKKLIKSQSFIKQTAIKYSNLALQAAQEKDEIDGEHGDLIPYLMSKTLLTKEQVLSVISEFIFAGVDTTSHHLCFVLYLLGRHPDIQETLYQEIREHFPTSDTPITANSLNYMTYLKAVTKETHRLLPVAPGNIRRTTTDVVLSGYHIPAGTSVAMHSDFIARDPKEFSNPNDFIPERWIRGKTQKNNNNPFAFLPFGFGPRSCIGKRLAEQESQIAIIKLLQKYRLEYVGDKLRCETSITYSPVNKMSFRFTERDC